MQKSAKHEQKDLFYQRPANHKKKEVSDLRQGLFDVISVANITIRSFMLNFWIISAILYIDP